MFLERNRDGLGGVKWSRCRLACKCVSVHVVKWRTVLRPHGSAMLENTRDAGKPGSMGKDADCKDQASLEARQL